MAVVAGCGVYLDRPHPEHVARADAGRLADRFAAALEDEIEPGAGFRAGLLGLIGTSEPVTASERRVLRGAGAAAERTGAAVSVRLDPSARRGEWVLAELGAAGCPPEQVIFANVDEFIDLDYLGRLARAGATLEWCFGNEAYYRDGYKDPTDAERLDGLLAILGAGLEDRCVLGCSVWTKTQLRTYGGMGYDHLLRRIVPSLRSRGVPQPVLDAMLVDNPRRLLERP
jgi:phosphotriesterase-related protein